MTERKPMIAVPTGAGISTDSGIPDFRGVADHLVREPIGDSVPDLVGRLLQNRW